MVKGDAKWVQAAGVYNMVGGDFTGTQFGGVLNSVRGDFLGLQAGGVTSATGGNFTGMQVGGILSSNHKDVLGFQVGGISALTKGRLEGMQLAGIFTASYCGFRGIQVAGISTVSDSVSVGMQISGIHNAAHGELQGAQLAGISNYSRSGINFLQGAGIGNIADKNYGLQAAGIFNFAKRNDCLQIGLVNTSVDGKGVSIGLINFVAKGYHKTEVSTNELFLANVTLKSGVRHFYNVYNFSAQFGPNPTYAAGFGFGTNFDLKGKWTMSCDLSGQMLFEDHFESFGNQLYKFSTTADRELAKWVTVFFGPTLNINVIQLKDAEGAYTSNLDLASIYDEEFPEARVRMSVGGRIGFRF
jgi:hypothetical protein